MAKRKRLWLVIGITIIAILLPVAIHKYRSVVLQTKETVLKDSLFDMRRVIDQYIKDKQTVPQSLQDLIQAGFLRQLPNDPITNSNSSWNPVIGTVVIAPGKTGRGITDLRSGSNSISSKGTAYSTW
jgi:general secretion pathway protein G